MEAQREADIRFLRMAMPGMQYSPLKLAQVLQKYSLNRVISHYGKKLVREVSQQPEYHPDMLFLYEKTTFPIQSGISPQSLSIPALLP